MVTSVHHDNTKALDAYITAQLDAQRLCEAVQALLAQHQDSTNPEAIHWGHVGDIQSIANALRDIVEHEE